MPHWHCPPSPTHPSHATLALPPNPHPPYQPYTLTPHPDPTLTPHPDPPPLTPLQDVKVAAGCPHLFWSAGEDGYVRQYDSRMVSAGQARFSSRNALLRTSSGSRPPELKGLDVNKVRGCLCGGGGGGGGGGSVYVCPFGRQTGIPHRASVWPWQPDVMH
jgi:hypothetical protein